MQFSGGPGAPAPRPGTAPTPAQVAQAQAMQAHQMQAMQAALAASPALQAQFVQQQALLQQQARAIAAAQAGGGGAAAAAAAAAAARPGGALGAPTTSKNAIGAITSAVAAAPSAAVRTVEAVPAKKAASGRKRKAGDQRLPDRGDLLLPDSPLFTQLQDAERRVDMLISRKRHELQEMYASFRRGPPGSAAAAGSARKRLRVYLRSEHQHQQNAADAAEPPSWVLSISGRLLGKDKAADKAAAVAEAADEGGHHHHKHSFTHYVRRVEVVLDPAQYPGDSGRFVWEKSQHEREHREALHVRRLGSAPVDARVTVQLDHQPAQWRLSGALAAALGLRGLHSSPFVMQMLWGYIKAKQLYEPNDRGAVRVRCDDKLRELFHVDSLDLARMSEALKPHLTAPPPVTLQYTIRPDGPAVAHPDCYDFDVEVPLSTELPPYIEKAGANREAEQLDVTLAGVLTRLAEHRRRRTLLLAFAQHPVDFVQALVAAQGRELRLAASKEGEAHELLASGEVFKERWVDDCVMNYMARKQQQVAAAQQAALAEQQAVVAQQQAMVAVHQQQQALAAAQQQQQQQQVAAMAAQQVQLQAMAALQQQQQAAAAAGGGVGGGLSLSLQQMHQQHQQLQQLQQLQQQRVLGHPPGGAGL